MTEIEEFHTEQEFERIADQVIPGFGSSALRVLGERIRRQRLAARIVSFGVSFLDDCMGPILPHDLVVIGAKTGIGKTSLATLIAVNAATQGKKVFFFGLEAERDEIERRIKFSRVAELARANGFPRGLSYLDWYLCKHDTKLDKHEIRADAELSTNMENLHTFYRTQDFYSSDYERMVKDVQETADLIILDHLHYVDTDDINENRAFKNVVKRIRDVSLRCGKPVVVVAHLRKAERHNPLLVPSIDDFHGTSDITKIATKAIIIAPAYEHAGGEAHIWGTYIAPVKCRIEGSRTRYVGLCWYDARMNKYTSNYQVGRLSPDGAEWKIEEKIPEWAIK